ncbi:hypothetical protein UAW_03201 [Enterococcus haemoperoxidus ATCC BAA-382]|uniref:Uncharacterized protein n=1 Tax=Enterococcus haemoperoxidus ATCC BAA-382 TaxID=1158608 RepID=R2SH63_9ENTE|nr:hypothetical protein [Enterococcus haemoperoxidus]EOH92216.1 hypothetical protein UAW_03201 [Enterococcus haemoperoxidus ATCC BAA-382]EOT61901.1 hypothetical protein I583_00884 [Enterococcus haemoperoxidus ATCC BAA-382]
MIASMKDTIVMAEGGLIVHTDIDSEYITFVSNKSSEKWIYVSYKF